MSTQQDEIIQKTIDKTNIIIIKFLLEANSKRRIYERIFI